MLLWLGALASPLAQAAIEGLPLIRFYPFEEIGSVSRGAHLSFDAFGRIAVTQNGEYLVLNDGLWLQRANGPVSATGLQEVKVAADGTAFYGALGSWGRLQPTPAGTLRPESLVPVDCPKWVPTTGFTQILCTEGGVYFAGWNGAVFWERSTGAHRFFEARGLSRLFAFKGKVFVSTHNNGVIELDPARGPVTTADSSSFGGSVVREFAAGHDYALFASTARRLYLLRDGRLSRLPGPLAGDLPGSVSSLQRLPDGNFAIAIANRGVFLITPEGAIKTALTSPEYRGITALASHEPGVLWAAGEAGVSKILYGQPFTTFGRALGLPTQWPQVVAWKGQPIVASDGQPYESIPSTEPGPTHFRLMAGAPRAGTWGIATVGSALLAANGEGVFVRDAEGRFTQVLAGLHTARLVALDETTCLVIGEEEIAALRLENGVWSECTARIPGAGYPNIVHAGNRSAWVEYGVNHAARLTIEGNRLVRRSFEQLPWSQPQWVHVSVIGTTVAIIGAGNDALFFDEETATMVEAPDLRELLAAAPYPIQRLCRDETGTVWASHEHGLMAITTRDGRRQIDSTSFASLNESTPLVRALPGGALWVGTGHSLYVLNPDRQAVAPPPVRPVLVSMLDSRSRAVIDRPAGTRGELGVLPYRQNSLTLDFFAGSYASMRPLGYDYRLNQGAWSPATTGSSISLSDLPEGDYHLAVRARDNRGPVAPPAEFRFAVAPPWYRRWYAYASYPLLAAIVLVGLFRLLVRRAEARNAALERLVAQRTGELQATMRKLQQETLTSATLAERNRLAGEIHDSLEQCFTGLSLQLETTANFASCPPEVGAGLAVALNMVGYGRNEVRHVVRDLHAPILDSADLETALRQIITHVAPMPGYATIQIQGAPTRLDSTIEHHLLRIAQEAIANAVKHAAAKHLLIILSFQEREVELTIRDDGKGFVPQHRLSQNIGHFGLPSFRGRAAKMGGTIKIVSTPGAGTEITVRVPLAPTAKP